MTINFVHILFLCLLSLGGLTSAKSVDIEGSQFLSSFVLTPFPAVRYVKNPQIQKFFTETSHHWEPVEEKLIISSTRVPSWDVLDEKLEPIQRPVDISDVGYDEADPFQFNYFEMATDQSLPLYKLSDPAFCVKDERSAELQNFKFDPPYLNFSESSLFATSVKPISFSNLSDKFEIKIVANKTEDPQLFVMHDESFTKLVKPGIRHKLKVGLIPTSLKGSKSTIIFTVHLLHNKRVIAARNLVYEVYIHGLKNPFEFEPIQLIRLTTGETWGTSLSIFNPSNRAFNIENVAADDEDLEIRVPWDVNTILEDVNKPAEEIKDMSVVWNIAPQKKQKFLYIGYTSETVGLKRVNLFIDTPLQNFTIPLVFMVKPKTLVLDKELYDLGVVINPKIPHEIQINITNIFNYTIQILEIYASVPKDSSLRIFQKENKSMLGPFQEDKLIAKLRLLPTNDHRIRSYEGKILIQTNDTGIAHFIEARYRYAYYPNLIVCPVSELSYFVRMQGDNIYTDRKDHFNYVEDEATGGILELTKGVHMTNSFLTILEFSKIHFPSASLTIQSYRASIKLPLYTKMRVFDLKLRIPVEDLNTTHFNTWFAVEAHGMLIPIHVNVYDKRLYCSMNIDGEDVTEKCYKMNNVSLNFGYIAANEARRKTLTLTNYNPNDISIVSINCTIPNCFTEVLDASLEHILNENDEIVVKEGKVFKSWDKEKPVYKGLAPNHKAVFSFIIDKAIEESKKGEIIIQTVEETIRLPLSYQILQGNLTFTPQIVRFQPAFPGKKQEAKIAIRNLFNTTVVIKQIESENPEIIPVLTSPILHPTERVEAFKIIFDPFKNKQINFLNTATSSGEYMYGITLEDLFAWKQAKYIWDDLITSSSTEIRDWVRVVNNLSEKTFIQVRASLTNPLLIKEPIDFGVTKVHARSIKNITIENPSDLPIYVQLLLGPEEFSNISFVSQMFRSDSGEDAFQGTADKHQFCLVDFLFENNEDDEFTRAFFEDRSFQRYTVRHVNLGFPLINSTNGNNGTDEDELRHYVNRVYHCVEGNINNIDSLRLNYTQKFTKRLIQEEGHEDQFSSTFEPLHSQNIKETPIYEIRAMTYAQPKPMKTAIRAKTIWEKIKLYFQDLFDFTQVTSLHQTSLEQTSLMEKLKQNIKEIYIQNFNSLQKEQQIFLNPEYRDLSILIPPHSNITIPALIHQPTSNKESEIKLYIKNNLTSIFQVPVKAVGGSGNLIVTDVKRYDEAKRNFVRSTEELLEGDVDHKKMKFYIDRPEVPIVDAKNCHECPPGTKKLRLDRPFKRRFTLKNDGNLPLEITGISIQNLGCEGYGFSIDEDCTGFTLDPNQERDLEIKFIPDMSLTYFTRTLMISTNQGNFEFEIHVKMPFKNLYDNFDIYHFKTRAYIKVISYLIIIGMIFMCYKLLKESISTGKPKSGKSWRLHGQEILNYKHPNEIFENIISVKHTFAPMIPATKLMVAKKAPLKIEKPIRTSKTPLKHNEFKEETAVNLNKFEDSDGDNTRGMKFIEETKRVSAAKKKQLKAANIEEKPTTQSVVQPKPQEVQEKVPQVKEEPPVSIIQQQQPEVEEIVPPVKEETVPEKKTIIIIKEKKPYEKKPYEKKTFERRQYEKKQFERRQYEKKLYEKKKVENVEEQKTVVEKRAPESVENEKKAFESEHEHENDYTQGRRQEREIQHKESTSVDIEEEKRNESKQEEKEEREGIFSKEHFETKSFDHEKEEEKSDEGLEGEILDYETKHVIENVIDDDDEIKHVGFIGSKAGFNKPRAGHFAEPQPQNLDQSLENSEFTSEDETKGFYNYFGSYDPMRRTQTSQFQDYPRQSNSGHYGYFSNHNDFLGNMPGLGLFQTKRKTSRYDKYTSFPASTRMESPKRKLNINRTPFYTGSEDESGVISESSISSKPFYNHFEIDEEKTPSRAFNFPKENHPYSFAQVFFPNMEHVSPAGTNSNAETPFFEKEAPNYEMGFDESKLNYLFGGGVRFRNLEGGQGTEDPNSSELPPGLH